MSDVQLNQDFWKLLLHGLAVPLRIVNDDENFLANLAAKFSRIVSCTVSFLSVQMKTNNRKWFDKLSRAIKQNETGKAC